MSYQIRKAKKEDIAFVEGIYADARRFMAEHGNPNQWGTSYPSAELIQSDIAEEKLYIILREDNIHGVFYFGIENDPAYDVIFDGAWHADSQYGVIHRVAGSGSGGILWAIVEYAIQQIDYLRMDTHADNYVMQRALEKLGFRRCGIIRIQDGSTRIAYDRIP